MIDSLDEIKGWEKLIENHYQNRVVYYSDKSHWGEGWIEFSSEPEEDYSHLSIRYTYRPRGLLGRFYWLLSLLTKRKKCSNLGVKAIEKASEREEKMREEIR